jgi:hypothetical protein
MAQNVVIREAEPGEASLATYFYYKLYEQEYSFKPKTEQYFMQAMAEVFGEGGKLWVATNGSEIIGSIAIVKTGEQSAQLRLLAVSPKAQGMGLGSRLMQVAMDFCAAQNYRHIVLWTIDILKPARYLYAKFGFEMTQTKPNSEWTDATFIEEKWERNE